MNYWIIINDERFGPMTAEDVLKLPITPDTPVWYDGLADWTVVREVPELQQPISGIAPKIAEPEETPSAEEAIEEEVKVFDDTPKASDPTGPLKAETPQSTPGAVPPPIPTIPQPPVIPQPMPPMGYQMPMMNGMVPTPPNGKTGKKPEPKLVDGKPCPPNYLAWSILSTILCCIPLGIPAIIFSARVRQCFNRGDLAAAEKMSERAQWFIILAISIGLLTQPLQMLVQML